MSNRRGTLTRDDFWGGGRDDLECWSIVDVEIEIVVGVRNRQDFALHVGFRLARLTSATREASA